MSDHNNTHGDDDIDWVSKSEVKREMHKLQAIGERLLKVKKTDLDSFPLTDELVAAIDESKRIKSHEAMRRHLQYIGKQMRSADLEGIQKCLDRLDSSSDFYLRAQNQSEMWREKLIKTDTAEGNWIEQHPNTDRQPFRSLVRAAKKEQPEDPKAPITGGKNSKKLLQWLREELLK